ncbi:MAG: peptidoglycan editing factor PgeF [Pseudomonadota bacterium]
MTGIDPIEPAWPVASPVRALTTTRAGGVSEGPWASLNLGTACGDAPAAVAENRRRLTESLPSAPCWLRQVHGCRLIHARDWVEGIEADAIWTDQPEQVCAILSADCLPVLIADREGEWVAAVHAGWRGLAAGILERVVDSLPSRPSSMVAWIGPSIGSQAYEVDAPVRNAMLALDSALAGCFEATRSGHWEADLQAMAWQRLSVSGVDDIVDAKLCTASDAARFYSHRRDQGRSGRQATLIWLEPGV